MARTVTAHLFSSINGVVEDPHLFQFDAFGEAEGELMDRSLDGVEDVVMGRRLFDEWSEYWPPMEDEDPFAAFINAARKHVLSTTREGELGWNGRVIEGDAIEHIAGLREQPGGNIVVAGGVEATRRLFLAGAIDLLTLTVHPAAAGEGRRLFDDSSPTTRLRLEDHQITPVGNAVLTYSLRD